MSTFSIWIVWRIVCEIPVIFYGYQVVKKARGWLVIIEFLGRRTFRLHLSTIKRLLAQTLPTTLCDLVSSESEKKLQTPFFIASSKFNYTIWPITNHFWVSLMTYSSVKWARESEQQQQQIPNNGPEKCIKNHKTVKIIASARRTRKHWKKFTHLSFFMLFVRRKVEAYLGAIKMWIKWKIWEWETSNPF